MEKARANYESMDRKQLIAVIDYQHEELIKQEAITREYQKQLQETIEYYSIERYRSTVQKNREAAGTASQDD